MADAIKPVLHLSASPPRETEFYFEWTLGLLKGQSHAFLLCCLGSPVESSEGKSFVIVVPISKLPTRVVHQTPLSFFVPVFHSHGWSSKGFTSFLNHITLKHSPPLWIFALYFPGGQENSNHTSKGKVNMYYRTLRMISSNQNFKH